MFENGTARLLLRIGTPLAIVLAALLLGLLVQRLLFRRLHRLAARTANRWDDVLVGALRGVAPLAGLLAGVALALKATPLPPPTLHLLARLVAVLAIAAAVFFTSRLAVGVVGVAIGRMAGMPTTIFKNVTAVLIYVLGALVMLDYLGISIAPIITALGIGGLAVALALQDTLANLFAGIHLLVSQKIRPGDYVRLEGGEEGHVTDITWRNTTIRALANNLFVIPNSKVASSVITNFHLPSRDLSVLVDVGVAYGSDLERVEAVAIDVARQTMRDVPGGVPEIEPFIRFNRFADSAVLFTVILRGQEYVDQYLIKHEFLKRLHRRFLQEGIEIPFPTRSLFLRERLPK